MRSVPARKYRELTRRRVAEQGGKGRTVLYVVLRNGACYRPDQSAGMAVGSFYRAGYLAVLSMGTLGKSLPGTRFQFDLHLCLVAQQDLILGGTDYWPVDCVRICKRLGFGELASLAVRFTSKEPLAAGQGSGAFG